MECVYLGGQSINDGVDSEQSGGLDITPFKNILNEFYLRNISKKVKSGKHIRALDGKFMGTTAPTVRLLYSLALEGYGTNRIGKVFYERNIPKPSYYKQEFSHSMIRVAMITGTTGNRRS